MNLKSYLGAGILSVMLLIPSPIRAISFLDFGKMNDDDESTYVAQLIEGAVQLLRAHGHPDQAAQTLALFKDTGPHSGVRQLAEQSKRLNALNDRNATNPNNRVQVYVVEDAMEVTLKDNGIIVSVKDLRTINQNFRPIGPRRSFNGQ
jgi:hypothetical protein